MLASWQWVFHSHEQLLHVVQSGSRADMSGLCLKGHSKKKHPGPVLKSVVKCQSSPGGILYVSKDN